MKSKKVLFIDTSFLVRVGMNQIIREYFPRRFSFDTIPPEALCKDQSDILHYDMVIIGTVPQEVQLILAIKQLNRPIPILVFPATMQDSQAMSCLIAGANGYLAQDAGCKEISFAISTVMGGNRYLCQKLIEKMAEENGKVTSLDKTNSEELTPSVSLSNRSNN